MDDFLHNLRTGKNKTYDRNRKPYDNNVYKSPDRQNAGDNRRRETFQRTGSAEHLTAIKKLLEDLTDTQKRLIEIEEKRATSEERIATALEIISTGIFTRKPENSAPHPEAEFSAPSDANKNTASDNSANTGVETQRSLEREQLVELISSMRKEQMSFEKIARNLEQQGISTLSGKGAWRSQAVAKLCQQFNVLSQEALSA